MQITARSPLKTEVPKSRLAAYCRAFFPAALAAALWLGLSAAAEACPSCKAALAGDPRQANLVRGFFWSILFMLSMPFTILGVFSTSMYVAIRKDRARKQQAAQQASALEDPTIGGSK